MQTARLQSRDKRTTIFFRQRLKLSVVGEESQVDRPSVACRRSQVYWREQWSSRSWLMECGVQQEVHSLLCSAEAYANEVANSYVKKAWH